MSLYTYRIYKYEKDIISGARIPTFNPQDYIKKYFQIRKPPAETHSRDANVFVYQSIIYPKMKAYRSAQVLNSIGFVGEVLRVYGSLCIVVEIKNCCFNGDNDLIIRVIPEMLEDVSFSKGVSDFLTK